ncbi:hypothetical protein [Streptomyces africanus]|uniref:hypothetical protein n=1 Tax=Streptomyces africanus TaxID=231024 RepID=UPI000A3B28B7|nr:hypothetical protein [Streptomyces africanus]
MNRRNALELAAAAADRAAALAEEAERLARHDDFRPKTGPFAAAGSLWADTSRAYTALAVALPETTTDTDEQTEV